MTPYEQRAWCEIRLREAGFGPALNAGRVVWQPCACKAQNCRGWVLRTAPIALPASHMETADVAL